MSNEIGNDSFENLSEEDRKNIDILSTAYTKMFRLKMFVLNVVKLLIKMKQNI